MTHPIAELRMAGGQRIRIELYPEEAPNTVASFVHLAQRGIYNGHTIERLVPGFVADMSYTAFHQDCARYLIAYETQDAGFPNHLEAVPGTIVMGGYDQGIAGGEFFFPFVEKASIRTHYPAFGKVIEGMEEIMRWNTLPVVKVDFPLDPAVTITAPAEPLVIESVTVALNGWTCPEVVKLDAPLPANWG